jgi:uncharacterized protein Yka (UPF0111/DUF47 family)
MGKNYSKEQKDLFMAYQPRVLDACNNPQKLMELVNNMKAELRARKKDLHMILVDIVKIDLKSNKISDQSKFFHLLVGLS